MINNEMLNYAIENGMIDFDTIKQEIEMNERKKYLNEHPNKIWQGTNGLWYTYLPDAIKGRTLKKRNTKKEIETVVIEYWKANSEENQLEKERNELTLKKIFPIWLKQKDIHSNSSSAIKRILCDWNKYYVPQEEFINKPIKKFTKLELDNWAHTMIKQYEMTSKTYYNMSMIIRQCFDLASSDEVKCIPENTFRKFKVNTKLFRRQKKKSGKTQVYTFEEQIKLIAELEKTFKRNPKNTFPLAVMLWFELGARVAEICGLKFSDIDDIKIWIQRQVVVTYKFIDDYKMIHNGFKVVEYTKTEDSYRDVYLTSRAIKIINLIKKINLMNGESNDGFIFVRNGTFVRAEAIERTIKRACERAEIPYKSGHKIRKTYISSLIDSGLNIDEIRKLVGHSDEKTTYGNYCFNRLTDSQTLYKIENALNPQKVITGNQNLLPKN